MRVDTRVQTLTQRAWCLLVLLLAACSSESGDNSSTPAGATPTPGGRIVIGIPGEPDNFNPLIRSGTLSGNILGILNPSLARMNTQLLWEPNLASHWTWSEDRLELTYHLKPGYVWSDGEPFTAHDVVSTWKLFIHPDVRSTRITNFTDIDSVGALDDHRVMFRFTRVSPDQIFNSAFSILPQHLTDELDPADVRSWPLNRNPVTVGPYRLKEWRANQHVILERNPHWGGDPAYLDEIQFDIIPDENSRMVKLQVGELDMLDQLPPKDIARLEEEHAELKLYPTDLRTLGVLSFNVKRGPLADRHVRQAVSHAVDRRALIEGVLYGYAEALATPVVPMHAWAQHPSLKPYDRDLAQSRELLAEAGWTDSDGDGIVDRDGEPLRLMLRSRTGDLVRENGVIIIQRNLRDIGIEVDLRLMELAATLNQVRAGDFDIYYGHSTARLSVDPSGVYGTEGGFNLSGFSDARVDSLIREGLAREDRSLSRPYWLRFQEIVYEEQPTAILYAFGPTAAIHSRFQNCTPHALSPWEEIEHWWELRVSE